MTLRSQPAPSSNGAVTDSPRILHIPRWHRLCRSHEYHSGGKECSIDPLAAHRDDARQACHNPWAGPSASRIGTGSGGSSWLPVPGSVVGGE